jgi:hypothetical protein
MCPNNLEVIVDFLLYLGANVRKPISLILAHG